MHDDRHNEGRTRRAVLRGLGAVGGLSLVGTVTAHGNKQKSYGNGNGLGSFLNEHAELKETPIWTGDVVDMRGMSTVEVDTGVTTDIIPTEVDLGPPFGTVTVTEAPVAYDPLVIKVSPGATVKWVWSSDLLQPVPGLVEFPIPHNVVHLPGKDGVTAFDSGAPVYAPNEFSHTFTEKGTYQYYCTPHGAPFPVTGPFGEAYNEFGMRGAVKVVGKPL